ncbi:MAG: hypothetical protein KatS3mg076_1118 [Candidatus Binatia bacterium]|nr:MAG: hypothetical protein KatS3mg076_1118 [Candidatus Binatia bacterium]
MVKGRGFSGTWVPLVALALAACSIGRVHWGSPLRGDPAEIREGESTKEDVLRVLGPPDRILHQTDGDVFVYSYVRRNVSSLSLRDPFFTRQFLFGYRRDFEGHDRVVVLFDLVGRVRAVAVEKGTAELPLL